MLLGHKRSSQKPTKGSATCYMGSGDYQPRHPFQMRQLQGKEHKSDVPGRTNERQSEGLAQKTEYLKKAFLIISEFYLCC